jgi:hypothetical protein
MNNFYGSKEMNRQSKWNLGDCGTKQRQLITMKINNYVGSLSFHIEN